MKCLDNIYTKHIKYNSPVLYQLESLKKEYEKLLKVSNEIIKTGSFIEECYFENQSAVLSDNEITFSGNLKFKTDAGNYFSSIPSSLKLNVQGTGEIVVDVGEDNKTLVFKLDEEFLSEISLMMENLETLTSNFNDLKRDYELLKSKFNSQIFDNFIGIRNTSDLKIDQIKHINNNFQITSNDGKSLLNIDEQLEKIYSFNKELSFTDASNLTEENVANWQEKLGGKVLWENANPTANFNAQSINLASDDYDFLLFEILMSQGEAYYHYFILGKGKSGYSIYTTNSSNEAYRYQNQERTYSYVNDTSYSISVNAYARPGSYTEERQDLNIPIRIIGFKGVSK